MRGTQGSANTGNEVPHRRRPNHNPMYVVLAWYITGRWVMMHISPLFDLMSTAVLSASATDSSLVHDHEVVGEPQNEIQTVTTTSQFSYPQTQFVFEANPAEPVLYLPPILSLLPVEYRQLTTSLVDNQTAGQPTPLSTESHLPSIDKASLSLHLALHRFRAVTREYATVAYAEAFNWDEIELPEDDEHDWYCVAFNSKRRAGSDGDGRSQGSS